MEQIHGVSDGNINISDVIEVIQTTDPEFVECNGGERDAVTMFSGGGVEAMGAGSVGPSNSRKTAYVKILEQPASKALRFRYECEGRSAGSIPGVNSTPENKTFPSIRIEGYKGRAVVVVSCVTKDPPYRPHPHNLVGKEACRRGVCTVEIASESMTVTFANLGIQCVKKKDIEEALKVREEIRVDPYRTGFSHRAQPTSIDLNAVRLCFQVFLEGAEKGKFTIPLSPVVSDPIYDKKAMSDLVICKLSDCCCTVAGGKEMILLCEKVAKEDIQVRFFEERDGQVVWEGLADFQPTQVHKQVAISFRAPRYRILEVEQPVKILIQLRRPSDGATSDALPFEYLPLDSGRPAFWSLRKAFAKKKADYNTFDKILATEATLLSNSGPKISRTIDEFNNNDLEFKKSHNKLVTLRALNDLYNIKNNQESRDRDNTLIGDDKSTNDSFTDNNNTINTKLGIDSVISLSDSDRVGRNCEIGIASVLRNNIEDSSTESKTNTGLRSKEGKSDWFDYTEVGKWVSRSRDEQPSENEDGQNAEEGSKSLNELLSQVAELDQIYADTQTKLLNAALEQSLEDQPMDVDVYDDQTYTSLQLAMKNPIELLDTPEDRKYEDVALPVQGPVISISPPPLAPKRDVTKHVDERLPPLPPKRIRKTPSMPVLPVLPTLPRASSTHTLNESTSTSQAPQKSLPSLPDTPAKHTKPGIFSKLFAKKAKKDKSDGSDFEASPVTGSQSNLNIESSASTLCKGSFNDLSSSNLPRPSMTSVTSVKSLRLDGDETPPYGIELTEAEHYALYTAMAPHATASEFDEMSFYYSPVEGDPKSKRKRKYANDPSAHVLRHLQAEAEKHGAMQHQSSGYNLNPIKAEPIERGPSPYQVTPGSGIPASGFSPVYGMERGTPSPQPSTLQPYRQQLSPGRTPSPMEYTTAPGGIQYNILPTHLHHQQHQQQQFTVPAQFQPTQQYTLQQQIMMNRAAAEQTGPAFLPIVNPDIGIPNPISSSNDGVTGVSSMLNLDSRQCSFEFSSLNQLDSTDLASLTMYDDNLSQHLSSNLSLSDIRVSQVTAESGRAAGTEASNISGGNGNSMTDSFTRLTTSTIQELCTLNDMYNPNRDNTG